MLQNGQTTVHTDPLITVAETRTRVQAAVDAAVEQAHGDLPEAAKILVRHAKAHPDLFQLIAGPFLPHACWQLMRQRAWSERTAIWTAPHMDLQQNGQRVHHLATENLRNLMEFRLPIHGLPKLGEAVKEQVQAGAEYYFKQSSTELQRGKWLAAVAALLKGKKSVRAQLKDDDLQRCFIQVQEGA